jgi:hypothetical protein
MSNGSKSKPQVSMPSQSFPNENVSDSERETPAFGLKVGQAISAYWFQRTAGGSCQYYSMWGEYHKRRLYARARQPMDKYKNQLATNGDMSYMNYDFTPVPIIPKFVDIIVNGMDDREMSVKAFSQDAMSAEKKSKFQEEIETDMYSKDFLIATQEQFGVNAFSVDPEKLPDDNDELALYMNLNYKPGIEIAEEIAIDTILQENHFEDSKRRINRDIVEIGVGMGKHEFQPGNGIVVEYVDPANVVYSPTEDPFFKDCFYWGEVKRVHINELLKIKPDLTEKDIEEIQEFSSLWNNYYSGVPDYGLFQKDVVSILYFNYKTHKDFYYKIKNTKTGGKKPIPKDNSFASAVDNDLFSKSKVTRDVWYEGVMILGTERILKWEVSKNMIRKSTTQHSMPNYVACAPRVYNGRIESHVDRMIPFADQIQLTHLKLQHIKSRMIPDGVFVDIDGINEINMGVGGNLDATQMLNLYFQTGSVFGRSRDSDGDYNNARIPIQELTKSSAMDKMQALVNDYNHQLNMLRDVTGLNESVDASTPDPKSLVGLQKLAALNSNTATRHILNASVYIARTLAEALSLRIADVLQYSEMKEEFAMKIGKYNVEILDEIKDLYLYNFGIFIEVAPDAEEKQILENNISVSLGEQKIELEDAIDIRLIRNIKQANEMLKVKRRKRSKEAQQREDTQMQMQAMIQQDSQRAAAEAKMLQIQAESQGKIAVKQAESQYAIQTLEAEAQIKSQLMGLEFQYNMQLKGIEVEGQKNKIGLQEDRKDQRIDRQSSQQSKLIEQRQKDLPPTNFESNNDNLADLDLSDFEPR